MFAAKNAGFHGSDGTTFDPGDFFERQLFEVGENHRRPKILRKSAERVMDPGFQVVLCAGSPDTREIASEMQRLVSEIQRIRSNVIWIYEGVDLPTKVALYSHADLFCCPSIYEPFGIINLEAMACETAVVASAVGGIK